MTFQLTQPPAVPQRTISTLIDRYGRWTVLFVTIRAIIGHKRIVRQRRLDSISDHVRRDIGLGPMPQSPPLERRPF